MAFILLNFRQQSENERENRFIYGNKVDVLSDGHTIVVPLQFYLGPSWKCDRTTCRYVIKVLHRNGNEVS